MTSLARQARDKDRKRCDKEMRVLAGCFGWPERGQGKTWQMFCELIYERFKDKLLKVDQRISVLTENRSRLVEPACKKIQSLKNMKGSDATAVFEDIKVAMLTLDMERLLAGLIFSSTDEKHSVIRDMLDLIERVSPSVLLHPADGDPAKRYDEFRALKAWKVKAKLEDTPPPGCEEDDETVLRKTGRFPAALSEDLLMKKRDIACQDTLGTCVSIRSKQCLWCFVSFSRRCCSL